MSNSGLSIKQKSSYLNNCTNYVCNSLRESLNKEQSLESQKLKDTKSPKICLKQNYQFKENIVPQKPDPQSIKRISDKINGFKEISDKIENYKSQHNKDEYNQINNLSNFKQQFIQQPVQQQNNSDNHSTSNNKLLNSNIINQLANNERVTVNHFSVEPVHNLICQQQQQINQEKTKQQITNQTSNLKLEVKDNSVQTEEDLEKIKLQEDINRLNIENIKLEKALKVAQENVALKGKNQNNTSSSFMLPSEFKSKWESLIKETLPNIFVNFLENPIITMNLVQDLIYLVQAQVSKDIQETNSKIMKILNLPNDKESIFYQNICQIYQDFSFNIFTINPEKIEMLEKIFEEKGNKIIQFQYMSSIGNNLNVNHDLLSSNINNDGQSEIYFTLDQQCFASYLSELLQEEEFKTTIKLIYNLCVYMQLNDPALKLPIEEIFEQRIYQFVNYKKNQFYLIDGFAAESMPSLVVLPPVMRNNYPYSGIRSAVLMLDETFITEKVKLYLEKEKEKDIAQEIEKKKKSDDASMIDCSLAYPMNNQQQTCITQTQVLQVNQNNNQIQEKEIEQQENHYLLKKSSQNPNQIEKDQQSQQIQPIVQNQILIPIGNHETKQNEINAINLNNDISPKKSLIEQFNNQITLNQKQKELEKENQLIIEKEKNQDQIEQLFQVVESVNSTRSIEEKVNYIQLSNKKSQLKLKDLEIDDKVQNEYRRIKVDFYDQSSNNQLKQQCTNKLQDFMADSSKKNLMESIKKDQKVIEKSQKFIQNLTPTTPTSPIQIGQFQTSIQDNYIPQNIQQKLQFSSRNQQKNSPLKQIQLSFSKKCDNQNCNSKENLTQSFKNLSNKASNQDATSVNNKSQILQSDTKLLSTLSKSSLQSPIQSSQKKNNQPNIQYLRNSNSPHIGLLYQDSNRPYLSHKPKYQDESNNNSYYQQDCKKINASRDKFDSALGQFKQEFLKNFNNSNLDCSENRIINQNVILNKKQKEQTNRPDITQQQSQQPKLNNSLNNVMNSLHEIQKKRDNLLHKDSRVGLQQNNFNSVTNKTLSVRNIEEHVYNQQSNLLQQQHQIQAQQSCTIANDNISSLSSSRFNKKNDLFNALLAIKKQMSITKQMSQRKINERKIGKIVNQSYKRKAIVKNSFSENSPKDSNDNSFNFNSNNNDLSQILKKTDVTSRKNSCDYTSIRKIKQLENITLNGKNGGGISSNTIVYQQNNNVALINSNNQSSNNNIPNGMKTSNNVNGIINTSTLRSQSVKRTMKSVLDSLSSEDDDGTNQSLRYDNKPFKIKMDYRRNKTYEKLYNELKSKKAGLLLPN